MLPLRLLQGKRQQRSSAHSKPQCVFLCVCQDGIVLARWVWSADLFPSRARRFKRQPTAAHKFMAAIISGRPNERLRSSTNHSLTLTHTHTPSQTHTRTHTDYVPLTCGASRTRCIASLLRPLQLTLKLEGRGGGCLPACVLRPLL